MSTFYPCFFFFTFFLKFSRTKLSLKSTMKNLHFIYCSKVEGDGRWGCQGRWKWLKMILFTYLKNKRNEKKTDLRIFYEGNSRTFAGIRT